MMTQVLKISDPVFHPKNYNGADRFLLQFLRDERDFPFIYLIIKVSVLLIPLAIFIYMPFVTGWVWWTAVIAFQVINAVYRTSFGLMMHAISHRPLFKRKYKNLVYYITWFIGPFIGHTPETYFSHHIGMHHAENNMPDDDSSTMYYQRDSLRSFLKYVAKFIFTGFAGLINYLTRKNRNKLARRAFDGEVFFYFVCLGLCLVDWKATFAVFIFTFIISRIFMMLGNWVQHAFIDPENPDDPYRNSMNCINIRHNHIAWNNGYHTSHHEKPNLHYTEHPKAFLENLDKYAENRAIVFVGLEFASIFIYLTRKRYDLLAKYFLNLNNVYKDDEEIMMMLRQRTRRFKSPPVVYHPLATT